MNPQDTMKCERCGKVVLRALWLKHLHSDECEKLRLRAENKRLREFARHVIRQECWSLSEQDGGDIQELAEKLGLIVPCIATAEDVDDESDYEVGDPFFKFSDVLKESTKPTGKSTREIKDATKT